MRVVLLSVFILLVFMGATLKKVAVLPKELHEISGLTFVNDTILACHNDSGDSAIVYLISTKGKIQNKVTLSGVKNLDFEDITSDGNGTIYLADIGNNANMRKDLVIYKFSTKNLTTTKTVTPSKIRFSYPEQHAFPPAKNMMYYDAECIGYYKDSLYIFTKCRTEPFEGTSKVYSLPCTPGTYKAKLLYGIKIGKRDWYRDAVTGGDFYKDELYLLTYNRIIHYSIKNRRAKYEDQEGLSLSQKEALTVARNGLIYIADEHHKLLGGGNLYTLKWDKK